MVNWFARRNWFSNFSCMRVDLAEQHNDAPLSQLTRRTEVTYDTGRHPWGVRDLNEDFMRAAKTVPGIERFHYNKYTGIATVSGIFDGRLVTREYRRRTGIYAPVDSLRYLD